MTKLGAKQNDTRERILDAALTIFTQKGYEAASVRMILDASGAVAGSFYHFFASKEALFEAVVEHYLADYAEQVSRIADDAGKSPAGQLDAIMDIMTRGTLDYFGALRAQKLHWTVQYAMHEKTMLAILPSVERMVENALKNGHVKSRLHADTRTLAAVLLKGVEGIVHAHPLQSLNHQQLQSLRNSVKEYVALLLEPQRSNVSHSFSLMCEKE